MKIQTLAAAGALFALSASFTHAAPLGTAFTYQGHLTDGGASAHGLYSFDFVLYDAPDTSGGIWGIITTNGVPVTNGLFEVVLDFGDSSVFSGEARWLQILVNGQELTPWQPLRAVPYALAVTDPNVARTDRAANFSGTVSALSFQGDGSQLVNVGYTVTNLYECYTTNAQTLEGLDLTSFWLTCGNSNTLAGTSFVGTTDNQALELKVNNERAWRLEPNAASPNVLGGHSANSIAAGVFGAVIGGGGANGTANSVSANYATVGGGRQNSVSGSYGSVPGGYRNTAAGSYSLAAGYRAKASHVGAFVWADSSNLDFASTANNQFLIRASGNVGINKANPTTALDVSGTVTADYLAGNGSQLRYIGTAALADGAVTSNKLANNSVDSAKIADAAVTDAKVSSLNASKITAGTLPDARLSSNVALLNKNQTFTGSNDFTGVARLLNSANSVAGTFSGNGSGVTALNANNLASGTVPDARLGANVMRSSGTQTFGGPIGIGVTNPHASLELGGPQLLAVGSSQFPGARSVCLGPTGYPFALVASELDSSLSIVDVSTSPYMNTVTKLQDGVGGFNQLGGACSVAMENYIACVAAYNDSALTIIDVINPWSPALLAELKDGVGGYSGLGGARAVFISGSLVYVVAAGDGVLTIIDVSNPTAPIKVTEFMHGALYGASSIYVAGGFAYVTSASASTLTIIDVGNPYSPNPVATLTDGYNGFNQLAGASTVCVASTKAYVTAQTDSALTIMLVQALSGSFSLDGIEV